MSSHECGQVTPGASSAAIVPCSLHYAPPARLRRAAGVGRIAGIQFRQADRQLRPISRLRAGPTNGPSTNAARRSRAHDCPDWAREGNIGSMSLHHFSSTGLKHRFVIQTQLQ